MRLSLAFQSGLLRPSRALVLHPKAGMDLDGLNADIVQPFRPDFEHWQSQGMTVTPDMPEGEWPLAIVCAARSKDLTRGLIAQAAQVAQCVVVDGQKTDGIDSYLKAVKARSDIQGVLSKAHGKLFWFEGGDFADWQVNAHSVDGFTLRPGVFSADGPDPASIHLTQFLPARMPGGAADFGAGWGYLSKDVLGRGIASLDLIEADWHALECAKQNILDPRAQFHWADATRHKGRYDWAVMNPPFHTGRKVDPSLGQSFIKAAAQSLKPRGTLWMVCNAHLPYEDTLDAHFGAVTRHGTDRRFKVFEARQPR
ncbi:MAG: class I SAM-dependent methyltransferase [Planktomarina sp.]